MSFAVNSIITIAMAATMLSESNCIDMWLPKVEEPTQQCICCEADLKPYWLQELEKIELLAEEARLDDDGNIFVTIDATQLVFIGNTGMMLDVFTYVQDIFQDPEGTWVIENQSETEFGTPLWTVRSSTGETAILHFVGLDTD